MKFIATLLSLTTMAHSGLAEEQTEAHSNGEDIFEYQVGEQSWFTGEGVNPGGFLFPSLFVHGMGGALEPEARTEDFSTSHHDPQNEGGISDVHLHLGLDFNGTVTGSVTGFGAQTAGHEWNAELEEAYLHWHLNDTFTIGGGQFQNAFGFQSDLHTHAWSFVNQNLSNSRIVNEGEFISQGGEILWGSPGKGLLTLGIGGVRGHAHAHAHQHGHESKNHEGKKHHGEHEDEPFEMDHASFQSWAFTSDYRFRLPFDDTLVGSLSLGAGENGFGRTSSIYGAGARKVWNGHDHGQGGPEFCAGAHMLQVEVIGRHVDAKHGDGVAASFSDHGISNSIHYGLSDRSTVSLRHDWISAVELAELNDRHRLSAALSSYVDPEQRIRVRVQYDHTRDETVGSEHVAWFQIQLQWGGTGGSHAGHGH